MTVQSGISRSFAEAPDTVHRAAAHATHLYDTPEWFAVEVASGSEPRLVWATTEDGGAAYATLRSSHANDPAWPYARADLFLSEMGVTESPAEAVLPATLLGGRRPGHSSIVLAAAESDRAVLIDRLMATVIEHATGQGHRSLLVPFVGDDFATEIARGTKLPCLRFRVGRSWSLSLPGRRYEDWFGSLDRKVRFNEKATLRKLEEFEFGCRRLTAEDLDWIVPLEMAQYRSHGHDYGADAAWRLHKAYMEVLGERAWIAFAVDDDGEPAGFASLVRHDDQAWVRQVGISPHYDRSQLYFGLVYHTVIRWAYNHGIRTLDYSVTADNVKRKRGATPRDLVGLSVPLVPAQTAVCRGFQPVFA